MGWPSACHKGGPIYVNPGELALVYGVFIIDWRVVRDSPLIVGMRTWSKTNFTIFLFLVRYWSVTRRYPSLTGEQTIFKRVRPSSNSRPSS